MVGTSSWSRSWMGKSVPSPEPHLPFTNKEKVLVEISGSLAVVAMC